MPSKCRVTALRADRRPATRRTSRAILMTGAADDQRPVSGRLGVEERIPSIRCRYQTGKRVLRGPAERFGIVNPTVVHG